MVFMFLVFLAAFALEIIGTWVSVIGLSSMFAASQVVIILAVCLDFAKVITVSYTYTHWKDIKLLAKTYYLFASVVLMIITSAGAFGYLSGEFQKAISNTNQQSVQLAALTDEQGRNQKRKEAIDKQISQLPESNVRGRTQLIKQFGPEIKHINDRLIEIDKELPALKIDSIKKNVEVGPIIYVAEAFGTTPELAVKWVILTIIFVFDPLAIALLLAGNSLVAMRKLKKELKFSESYIKENPAEYESKLPEPQNYPPTPPYADVKVEEESHEVQPEVPWDRMPEVEPIPETKPHSRHEATLEHFKNLPEEVDPSLNVAKLPQEDDAQISNPFMQQETEDERETITLEQIMKPVHPVKIHKSSLDDIDARFGDLQEEDGERQELKHLFEMYQLENPSIK
jgi:hypothetical protein